MSFTESTEPTPFLTDPWEPSLPIPLNGVLERQKFGPILTAIFAVVGGLVVFQIVGGLVTFGLLLASGVGLNEMLQDLAGVVASHPTLTLVANGLSLVLGPALLAFLFARMHTTRITSFLRLRKPDLVLLVLAIVGVFGLLPMAKAAVC